MFEEKYKPVSRPLVSHEEWDNKMMAPGISIVSQFQGTHLCGEQGIYIMPGSKLGASSQGCQHILFVWDLETKNRGS